MSPPISLYGCQHDIPMTACLKESNDHTTKDFISCMKCTYFVDIPLILDIFHVYSFVNWKHDKSVIPIGNQLCLYCSIFSLTFVFLFLLWIAFSYLLTPTLTLCYMLSYCDSWYEVMYVHDFLFLKTKHFYSTVSNQNRCYMLSYCDSWYEVMYVHDFLFLKTKHFHSTVSIRIGVICCHTVTADMK